jgi:hypothetical protein
MKKSVVVSICLALLFFFLFLVIRSWLSVKDCGEEALGNDVPRIRSAQWRMVLDNPPLAAARFAPYAAMSALVYEVDKDCDEPPKITDAQKIELEKKLNDLASPGEEWQRVADLKNSLKCEDDLGLFYQVWKREKNDAVEVVIAFRGTTSGWKDWVYGNLRWISQYVTETQYERGGEYSNSVIKHFRNGANKNTPIKFFSTGHSLGGGIAQYVLYDRPNDYVQSFAFDPSPVIGFRHWEIENKMKDSAGAHRLGAEFRVYHFYESYEILTHLRVWRKLWFNFHNHVNEIRFPFDSSLNPVKEHSMANLAYKLAMKAKEESSSSDARWYAGKGAGCTGKFEKTQKEAGL